MSENSLPLLIVFARFPRVGMVKTRLVPPRTHAEAARLYQAFLLDGVEALASVEGLRLEIAVSDVDDLLPLRGLLLEELSLALPLRAQRGAEGGLGGRLAAAMEDGFAEGAPAVAIVGSDHPTLDPSLVSEAFERLREVDLVLGPTDDGGYYLVAMRRPVAALFADLPYSTDRLLEATLQRATELGLTCALLPSWYDIDTGEDLERLHADPTLPSRARRTAAVLEELATGTQAEPRHG